MNDTNTIKNSISQNKSTRDNEVASDTVDQRAVPQRPITIEVQRWRDPHSKEWQARAFAKITNTLRTSGIMQAFPADELKTLLCLLTFTTATGECRPTVMQIAHALGVSEAKARRRLEHLSQFQWQGRSFITLLAGSDGVDVYLPALGVIAPPETTYLEQPPQPPAPPVLRRTPSPGKVSQPGIGAANMSPADITQVNTIPDTTDSPNTGSTNIPRVGGDAKSEVEGDVKVIADSIPTLRERIIAASRRKYTRPRAEVEQMIAEQMGWRTIPDTTPHTKQPTPPLTPRQEVLRSRLAATGMDEDAVDSLLERFPPERIERQLDWLPHRDARNPAAFLIAAIDQDYEAPLSLRNNSLVQEGPRQAKAAS